MATAFRCEDGAVRAELSSEERGLFIALVVDLHGLVEPDHANDPLGLGLLDDATLSTDPVLARLLPDAYSDDAEASAEFRRLTEHGLRTRKAEALETMRSTLFAESLVLDREQSRAWLAGLNDLRLAIGTRMGLDDVDADAPSEAVAALYDWLTWMQDCLIDAITRCADTLTS